MCPPPFWNLKKTKTKKVSDSARLYPCCYFPPPPPPDVDGAPEKKVSESPLFVHVPPPLLKPKKKKKKRCLIRPGYTPVATPPPPPRRRWRSRKKKVSESPPPPRLSAFLGLARVSRLAAVRKQQYVVPPLSQIPGSAPEHVYKFHQRNLFFSEVPKVDLFHFGTKLFICGISALHLLKFQP